MTPIRIPAPAPRGKIFRCGGKPSSQEAHGEQTGPPDNSHLLRLDSEKHQNQNFRLSHSTACVGDGYPRKIFRCYRVPGPAYPSQALFHFCRRRRSKWSTFGFQMSSAKTVSRVVATPDDCHTASLGAPAGGPTILRLGPTTIA